MTGGTVDFRRPVEGLGEVVGVDGDDHEVLNVDAARGMGAAAEDLNFGQRHRVGRGAAEMNPQRLVRCGCCCVGSGHRDSDDGVAAEASLVGRAVEFDEDTVDGTLVAGVRSDERVAY